MGIYDRDYMQKQKRPLVAPEWRAPAGAPVRAPLWARIKFRLWLFFGRRAPLKKRDQAAPGRSG